MILRSSRAWKSQFTINYCKRKQSAHKEVPDELEKIKETSQGFEWELKKGFGSQRQVIHLLIKFKPLTFIKFKDSSWSSVENTDLITGA
ncbi:hypothetical protein L1887_39218 [Cichorium endivia]|nr:hypothetical protein L1887_39218 [Cichorium endivia]